MTLPPFQSLLDAYGRDVQRFLVASVGPVDADDCYQETWLSALRAYPRLRDSGNLKGWLLTIAHRKVIDHARGRSRRAVPVESIADTADRAGAVIAPVLTAGADDELWAAVARLPTKQRTAVALRFLADLAYAEIADVMDTSEPAARRNVHEALKRLREDEIDDRYR